MSAIWVEILATRGSAPRDAGTAMKVTADETEGTIGGGALEHRAIALAREMLAREMLAHEMPAREMPAGDMLATGGAEVTRSFPLGPGLGQCCGGSVTLRFTSEPRPVDPVGPVAPVDLPAPARRGLLWLWGAGHVGRAVVQALPARAFDVTWVDSAPERFPADMPEHVTALPAADMPLLAARAPVCAHHLIFTYSHDIDLALCAALLRRGAGSIGLIGSDTKRARFFRRLRAMGLDPAPITCPIGDKSLGKAPRAIAQGVVAALLVAQGAAVAREDVA